MVGFSITKSFTKCTAAYCTVLYCTVLYCTVLYCTVLYCTVLYCTVLYCTVLYCTVLYCTVLYCTVLVLDMCRCHTKSQWVTVTLTDSSVYVPGGTSKLVLYYPPVFWNWNNPPSPHFMPMCTIIENDYFWPLDPCCHQRPAHETDRERLLWSQNALDLDSLSIHWNDTKVRI